MKIMVALFISLILFGLTANLGHTRGLRSDEARNLIDAGTIVPLAMVEFIAMNRHPGAKINDIQLKKKYGIYLYWVEMIDPQGVVWELELDAHDGLLRKDHQDT